MDPCNNCCKITYNDTHMGGVPNIEGPFTLAANFGRQRLSKGESPPDCKTVPEARVKS